MLCGPEADKATIWRIAITDFFVLALLSLVSTAGDEVSMSNNADLRTVADGLRILVPMPDLLARGIDDLGFFPIIWRMELDTVLANVMFRRGERSIGPSLTLKIHFSCITGVQRR